MSNKHKNVFMVLNHIEQSLVLDSAITRNVSNSAFASIVGIPIGKKRNKIVLLIKTKLNTMEVLISKALFNSNFSHDDCISVNVLKEYNDMKEAIKNPKSTNPYNKY